MLWHRIAVRVPETVDMLDYSGNSTVYAMMAARTLAWVRVRQCVVILVDDLQQRLDPNYPRDGRNTIANFVAEDQRPLCVGQMAASVGISTNLVRSIIRDGDIPFHQFAKGHAIKVHREVFGQFLLEHRTPTRWEVER